MIRVFQEAPSSARHFGYSSRASSPSSSRSEALLRVLRIILTSLSCGGCEIRSSREVVRVANLRTSPNTEWESTNTPKDLKLNKYVNKLPYDDGRYFRRLFNNSFKISVHNFFLKKAHCDSLYVLIWLHTSVFDHTRFVYSKLGNNSGSAFRERIKVFFVVRRSILTVFKAGRCVGVGNLVWDYFLLHSLTFSITSAMHIKCITAVLWSADWTALCT